MTDRGRDVRSAWRTVACAVFIIGLAGCGDDDDGDATSSSIVGPAPADDVTAGAYADEWNALSQSLDVVAVDTEAPSSASGNWQLRLNVEAADADEGWALMQDFAAEFGCDLPDGPPRRDMLIVDC